MSCYPGDLLWFDQVSGLWYPLSAMPEATLTLPLTPADLKETATPTKLDQDLT